MAEDSSGYSQLVARTWADPGFRQKLLSDPRSVLPEFGINVPAGVDIRIVENNDKVVYFTLPPKPSEELDEEQLAGVAGGGNVSVAACCCCCPCCSNA